MTEKKLVLLGAAHVHLPDHLDSAREAGWRVAAVHDRDAGRARQQAEALDARVLDDPRDAARQGTAAFVCSETVHHPEDVRAALEAALPVFCEKPLTAGADEAEALTELAERSGVMLEIGYFLRSYRGLQDLRDLLRGDDLGAPVHVRANFSHDGGFADWLDVTGWMSEPALARYGGFADEGVHVLDWLMWTFGEIAGGQVALGHSLGLAVDDHGAAVLELASGATAVIEAGWTDTRMRLELDITCTGGGASLSEGRLRAWRRDGTVLMDREMEPLDAGRGSAAFLARCAAPDNSADNGAMVPPREAARVTRVLETLYSRRG